MIFANKNTEEKKENQRLLVAVARLLSADSELLKLVEESSMPDPRAQLLAYIREKIPATTHIANIHSDLIGFVKNKTNPDRLPLQKAVERFSDIKNRRKRLKRGLIYHLGLNLNPNERENFLLSIETIEVQKLATHYPPKNHWVYESKLIHGLWFARTQLEKQPDKRLKRHPMHLLDTDKLQIDVPGGKSAIFIDAASGEIVAVVIRNWVPLYNGLVQWVDEIVVDDCKRKKSARVSFISHNSWNFPLIVYFQLEDPGKICQVGFSGGLRSKTSFDWARNLLPKKHSDQVLAMFNYSSSCAFALFWNMARRRLPSTIIADFEKFLHTTEIPRMKHRSHHVTGDGADYTVKVDGIDIDFNCADNAPPVGFFGMNYAR